MLQNHAIILLDSGEYWICDAIGTTSSNIGNINIVSGSATICNTMEPVNTGKIMLFDSANTEYGSLAINQKDASNINAFIMQNKPHDLIGINSNQILIYGDQVLDILNVVSKKTHTVKCIVSSKNINEDKTIDLDVIKTLKSLMNEFRNLNEINPVAHNIMHIPYKPLIKNRPRYRYKIGVLDFQISSLLLNVLLDYFDITVIPHNTSYNEVKMMRFDAIIISDGPYNPNLIPLQAIDNIQDIINSKTPVIGFELGANIIARLFHSNITQDNNVMRTIYNDNIVCNNQNKTIRTHSNANYKFTGSDNMRIEYHNLINKTPEAFYIHNMPVAGFNFIPIPGKYDADILFSSLISKIIK